jgi:CxxC-x17-CxxC domain-containing protein
MGGGSKVAAETQMHCSVCEQETTVPFRLTQGRPVRCRSCFDQSRTNSTPSESGIAETLPALSSEQV